MLESDEGNLVRLTETSESAESAESGRSVLQDAFSLLETLGRAPEGLRVMELVEATGLPKTTVRRHIAQLVTMNAVRRVGSRHLVGSRLATLGRQWRPDAQLRQAVDAPLHRLADMSHTMAYVHVLEAGKLPMVAGAIPHNRAPWLQLGDFGEVAGRTAVGRVLFASQPEPAFRLRECWSDKDIRQLRARLGEPRAVVIDQEDAAVGISCAAAPIRRPNGECVAAVTAVVFARTLCPAIAGLVVHAAAEIGRALPYSE
ncbi:helix-turn-helix domain-containing protein [Nocardia sp. NPDC050175]|uniref:helix-turn-helix domain-containing protein n=1 Tax=Nocardia sp. NPDC050175 TaxID=3364317 RepID=UPI0037BA6A0E